MFYLYHHNDLGRLAELFAVLRRREHLGPLETQTVLVPNRGIGRWLRIQLAESERIAANIDIALTGEYIWKLLRASVPNAPAGNDFEAEGLRWHLYAQLPAMAEHIAPVSHYLGAERDEVRRYQLAARLADVFDKYMVYRADMLARWEAGATPDDSPGNWQAQVWRHLTESLGQAHRGRLLGEFVARLSHDKALQVWLRERCPSSVYAFGLLALPPDHLRFLYALSSHVDVHFLLPNPSAEYWGDVTKARLTLDAVDDDLPGEPKITAGHALLGALGRTARDTLRVLYSDELTGIAEPELGDAMAYRVPTRDSLLHRIQADIVELTSTPHADGMADDDVSFQLHACHSPLREIQVLQDQLLDLLAADDKRVAAGEITADERLAPRDIIVMLPDAGAYAPAIEAVFGGAPEDRYLPFGLADKSRSATHPIVTSIATLMDLPLSRWTASEMLSLLAIPAVMRRFGISPAELDAITRWTQAAGVRWGRNAEHREALEAGHFSQNSWRFGLDRLLLGVAQADEETLTDGIAPWSDLEGGITLALGKLWRFVDTLERFADELRTETTALGWQTRLNALLDVLIEADWEDHAEQRAVDSVRETFSLFEGAAECLDDASTLSWEAVREMLRDAFSDSSERQPFLSGGVTFCGLVPLRAVPFRVVCVLGVNDDVFPRQDSNRAFNVMYAAPRLGDRSIRDDDRLLFLQALTAARDVFYISYIGQDVRSGETLPASPIVGETLEFIHRHYFADTPRAAFDTRIRHLQPMQPFSARYLLPTDPGQRIFTFGREWQSATHAAAGEREDAAPIIDHREAPLAEPIESIDLESLKRFFDHPQRAFFNGRLKLSLSVGETEIEDEEPLAIDPLGAAALRSRLFESGARAGETAIATAPSQLERARGQLPPAPLDEAAYEEQAEAVNQLLPVWRTWQEEDQEPETVDIDLSVAGIRLVGRVGQYWPGCLRRLRIGKLKTRYRLRYWIDYLAVVASGRDCSLQVVGFGPDDGYFMVDYRAEVSGDDAREYLAALVEAYLRGQRRPLAFHPDLADGYKPDQKKAFENWAYRFKPEAYQPHYLTGDPYFVLALGSDDAPLGDEDDSLFLAQLEQITSPMNAKLTIEEPAE